MRDARDVMRERATVKEDLADGDSVEEGHQSSLDAFVQGSAKFVVPAFYIVVLAIAGQSALFAYRLAELTASSGTVYATFTFVIALALGYVVNRALFGAIGALIANALKKISIEK